MKAISTIARFFRQNGGGEQTQAKAIMSTPVLTISPDATVGEAAGLMLEKHVSCLPVVDDEEQLVGMLTHSDFELHRKLIGMTDDLYELLGAWATPRSLEDAAKQAGSKQVKDVMHRSLATITEEASIAELAELMLRRKVHRLPVMRGGKLVGIITRHDLLKLITAGPVQPNG